AIHRLLLVGVVVVQVARVGIRPAESDRVGKVRIAGQQAAGEPIYRRRIILWMKRRPQVVQSHGIACEIMIEADVLAEDDNKVFDWCCSLCIVLFVGEALGCEPTCNHCASSERCKQSRMSTILSWHGLSPKISLPAGAAHLLRHADTQRKA